MSSCRSHNFFLEKKDCKDYVNSMAELTPKPSLPINSHSYREKEWNKERIEIITQVCYTRTYIAWRILGTEKPDGLLFMGSHRVRHDWSDLACMHALEKEMATHSSVLAWRVQGWRSLVGCHLWGHTESDTTEATYQRQHTAKINWL